MLKLLRFDWIVRLPSIKRRQCMPFVLSGVCLCLLSGYFSVAVAATEEMDVPRAGNLTGDAGAFTDDQRFLALRDAAAKEDGPRAQELASQLAGYSLPSYVDYYRLKANLRRPAGFNAEDVQHFLTTYAGTAIADRLRNDWLLLLGKKNDWSTFDVQYPQFVLKDDAQLKCYALLSKLQQGGNVAESARSLLTSAKPYGEGCYSLVNNLVSTGQFSRADMWNQIRWSAETRSGTVTVQLGMMFNQSNVIKALDKPVSYLMKPLDSSVDSHEIALIALGALAKVDSDKAVNVLERMSGSLTRTERAVAWTQIALPAAQKLQPEALSYWLKAWDIAGTSAPDLPLSVDGYEWRVRSALRNADWTMVKNGIEAMPEGLRSEPTWVYWLGRAYLNQGQREAAMVLFQSIATQSQFYGQLAVEELGQKISIPVITAVPDTELVKLSANAGFQRARQFYALNLRFEAAREWNWELRKMTDSQLLAAAEFARQNGFLDRMLATSDRTKVVSDYTQRYPMPYRSIMTQATQVLGLDVAWVYGLIRQESRFITVARSNVGASGLMQVMPATARFVANKMKLVNFVPSQVNDIETNITLGTGYLSMIASSFNGSQALATAGYNAGPSRSRSWRNSLQQPVEGAIFAETIPFSETRGYVKNVLSNATYYAALFENVPQSLKARLGTISKD